MLQPFRCSDCLCFDDFRLEHAQYVHVAHLATRSLSWHNDYNDQKPVCALILAIVKQA